MAAVKLYFDKRAEREDGTYPLKLAVSHKGRFMISLKIHLKEDQFDGNFVVKHPQQRMLNNVIQNRIISAKGIIIRLGGRINSMSKADLRECIENDTEEVSSGSQEYHLADHFEKYITKTPNARTKKIYLDTLNKIRAFSGNPLFSDITLSWLESFDLWLADSNKTNTRAIDMRNIRAVFNHAIDHDLVPIDLYPFRKFKIKSEKTRKRSLTVDELALIRDHQVEPHQERYRDLFMLVFYLLGINIVDLLNLKEIKNGRIEYTRSKTGQLYSVAILPEAMEIIERYRGVNYLLNPLDEYSDYKDFARRMNENLQLMGRVEMVYNNSKNPKFRKKNKKKYHPLFPALTTYWARHTWATLAGQIEIPIETISMALGHEIGSKTTWIYYDFNQKKIDEANRKVIDYLNRVS